MAHEAATGGARKEAETAGGTAPTRCPVCSYPRWEGCRLCAAGLPATGPSFAPFDLVKGFVIYWRAALRVLNDKAYLGKIKLAVTLSLVLFVLLVAAAAYALHPAIVSLLSQDWVPDWISRGIALLLTLVAGFFVFPVFVTLFLFPALDPMSRIAEREALGFEPAASRRGPIADFWDSLDTGARILLFQLLAWVLCLPLTFFAPAGVPIAILASAFFAGFAWVDYPASRRGLSFGAKWRLARRHWALTAGFGLGFLLGLLVPFFNLFLVGPAGAVGAADLWFAYDKGPNRP